MRQRLDLDSFQVWWHWEWGNWTQGEKRVSGVLSASLSLLAQEGPKWPSKALSSPQHPIESSCSKVEVLKTHTCPIAATYSSSPTICHTGKRTVKQ
eukprot:3410758-Pyramimonas_sp.AAC.1